VAAGSGAAARLGELMSRHVIPAPERDLEPSIAGERPGPGDQAVP